MINKKWKKALQILTIFSVILLYATLGFLGLAENEKDSTTERDPITLKTLVGYSLEYKINQETKDKIICGGNGNGSKILGKNQEWQYDENLDIHLYSAYYDPRQDPYRYVRIIGLLPRNSSFYCQMFYENGETKTQKAVVHEIWSPKWGRKENGSSCRNYYPSIIGCFLPFETKIPMEISFVDGKCSGGNVVLRVRTAETNQPKKKFVVCVKPLDLKGYDERSISEWMGLNRLLGAEKILAYFYGSGEILNFYQRENKDFLEMIQFQSPPFRECSVNPYEESLWKKRKIEVISYNDCFYRNLYETEFVIPLDLDEIIVPKLVDDWSGVFRHLPEISEYASFSVRNAYFFSKYPKEAVNELPENEMLVRAKENSGESIFRRRVRSSFLSPPSDSTKSFVQVSKTLSVFNHYAFHVLGQAVRQYVFPESIMQLNHYRNACDPVLIDGCHRFLNYVTYDFTLEKFLNKLYKN